jgi:hypothetical protein
MKTPEQKATSETVSLREEGQIVTTKEQLPAWVQKRPNLVKMLIDHKSVLGKMEPGTARARIIMRDPIPEGTKVKRRKRYDR